MRAAVLYPFSNLRQVGWGNSLRVGLLLKYLSERGLAVTALSPAGPTGLMPESSVTFQTFRWSLWPKIGLRLRCWLARWQGGSERVAEVRMRHAFHNYTHHQPFWQLARTAIQASDVVFMDTPLWAQAVVKLCREAGKPLILTLQDVLSVSVGRTPAGREELLRLEVAALRQADHVACVAPDDLRIWQEYRSDVACLINPVDIRQCQPEQRPGVLADFAKRHELDDRPVVAFVGSAHVPNQYAVRALEVAAHAVPEAQFVAAGSCAARALDGLVRRLGVISADDLRCLYSHAALMVMPVPFGTGTSLKFVEALAYGKAIVASTVAARGYDAESGLQAVIADEPEAFIAQVRALLASPERRLALGEQARALAARFDYRTVFRGYAAWLPAAETHSP